MEVRVLHLPYGQAHQDLFWDWLEHGEECIWCASTEHGWRKCPVAEPAGRYNGYPPFAIKKEAN